MAATNPPKALLFICYVANHFSARHMNWLHACYSLGAALVGTSLFAWNPLPQLSPWALALAGSGLAAIYPCLMTRTPQRLGRPIAAHAIGFQVGAAMLGAAALPSATGWIAQHAGLHWVAATMLAMAAALFLLHEVVVFTTTEKGT